MIPLYPDHQPTVMCLHHWAVPLDQHSNIFKEGIAARAKHALLQLVCTTGLTEVEIHSVQPQNTTSVCCACQHATSTHHCPRLLAVSSLLQIQQQIPEGKTHVYERGESVTVNDLCGVAPCIRTVHTSSQTKHENFWRPSE